MAQDRTESVTMAMSFRRRRWSLLFLFLALFLRASRSFSPNPTTGRNRISRLFSAANIPLKKSNSTSSAVDHQVNGPVPSTSILNNLSEVNLLYNSRSDLVYNAVEERFVKQQRSDQSDRRRVLSFLSVAFVPTGVTPNYYKFMQWRIIQRFVNANLNVFGTQSLLLGLGIKTTASQLGALSAALKWVLKDALGKVTRMVWASRMGNRFDSDAKRWRMRSAFCYAAGNGLEIATYALPGLFLLLATLANCCKQVSMLTSSSTRSSIFNAFRDGSRENIGDITAKGEAQVAIVDLMGIASGVSLSKLVVGTSVKSILLVYFILQALEIVCVYRQLRTVQYRVLNFERMMQLITSFCHGSIIPGPGEMSRTERIFLPPKHLSRPHLAFGSLGRSKISPSELDRVLEICENERYLLVVGKNLKAPRLRRLQFWRKQDDIRECCHIVLHAEATKADIVKSTMALVLLRGRLKAMDLDYNTVRSADCYDAIECSVREANQMFGAFFRETSKRGWESPSRSMFGRVRMRADWPLKSR